VCEVKLVTQRWLLGEQHHKGRPGRESISKNEL